jgi:hypothetical protein
MRTRIEVSPHKKYIPPNSAIKKHKKPYQCISVKVNQDFDSKE